MKFDREQLRMVFALFAVAVVAAAVLGLTDIITREPIAAAQKAALRQALMQVLPAHSNDAQADVFEVADDDRKVAVYPAYEAGRLVGFAWEAVAPDGYSGTIRILVGVDAGGHIHAIRVTDHKETPGLGDGIVKDMAWLGFFAGKGLAEAEWRVKKDGGDFDQFTGATITPRAVVKAVKKALQFFERRQGAMLELKPAALKPAVEGGTELRPTTRLGEMKTGEMKADEIKNGAAH